MPHEYHIRSWFTLLIAALLLTGCATPRPATPVRFGPEHHSFIVGWVPARIILHPDGVAEVVPRDIDVTDPAADQPDLIPVFSRQEGGTLSPGVMYRGTSESGFHWMKYPGGVLRHADGRYEVEIYTWSVTHGPKGHLERQIHGSEMAEVYDAVPAPGTPMRTE